MKLRHSILAGMLILLFTVSSAQAQEFNLGIKGGLNLYNTNGNDISSDSRASFHLGLLGHIHINPQFAIQPELVYSSQGAELGNSELELNYLNVPILFQYMFDNGFRLQAGPQFGFLMGANVNGNDSKNDFKGNDVGLGVGFGYVHPPSGFGFDMRYNHGLTDISEGPGDLYNRGFQFGVFYLFKHK